MDHLNEFANLPEKRSLLAKIILILFSSPVIAFYLYMIIMPIWRSNWNWFTNRDFYILLSVGVLPFGAGWLFYKNTKAGWMLLSILSMILFTASTIFLKGYFAVDGGKSYPLPTILITAFVSLNSLVSVVLLYLNNLRKEFNIDTTLFTIATFVNVLMLFIIIISIG